ncbi:spore-associated protein A [Streptosporangium sp. NBC_01756]|uniref:spore-associated protein A n=1 Tax=Streptosporangium sp. NBC_01756 TaxID=2975950 RepID=UPI002DD84733|nr:spore-associated protein A [Streptosporangium sp. NBC_01756]WSC85264.1 spore-associated protein A [Streptosporangium sp. NBC_01756]
MRTRSKIATLASAALVSTWLVAGATPASAAGPCGSGYSRVGVYAVPASGARTGTLEVYYNSSARKNCALTYGYGSYAGRVNRKAVAIGLSGASKWAGADNGMYAQYAGPVYVYAPGCIALRAQVAGGVRQLSKVHCG